MTTSVDVPKRRALGKGLESLLPGRSGFGASVAPAAPPPEAGKPREIPLDQIERNPFQTRTTVDENALKELSASIAATGVDCATGVGAAAWQQSLSTHFQQPGERRWFPRSKMAGKATVPCHPAPGLLMNRRWEYDDCREFTAHRPEPYGTGSRL